MANTYFRFKQFEVQQNKTAMKVCTDACILGAYTPTTGAKSILDIGTGTGLLALMLAQRSEAGKIEGVEIEQNAYEQASENVQASPFEARIRLYHTAIQDFFPTEKYDLIVTNPPFYTDHLQSGKVLQDKARHTNDLPTRVLLESISRLLAEAGKVWVLLPPQEMRFFAQEARTFGLVPFQKLQIYTLPTKPVWRVIQGFGRQDDGLEEQTLVVSDAPQLYSLDFEALMKEYYLIF